MQVGVGFCFFQSGVQGGEGTGVEGAGDSAAEAKLYVGPPPRAQLPDSCCSPAALRPLAARLALSACVWEVCKAAYQKIQGLYAGPVLTLARPPHRACPWCRCGESAGKYPFRTCTLKRVPDPASPPLYQDDSKDWASGAVV